MTNRYKRRIRHLKGRHLSTGSNAVVLGLPGPPPTIEVIERAALVLRIVFIPTKDGHPAEGESYAQH